MSYNDMHPTSGTYRIPQLGISAAPRRSVPAELQRLRSVDLFRDGHNELLIEHRGECYRLRLTRQDKLILNK
ncbi:hemin uptake protein HemP [Panacagrimonas sp.]|uniref:hemin uptake protein HemP n=1 Tax=Panacagrimonas sp. TaxID=2480088 RepID=UPI003B5298ED